MILAAHSVAIFIGLLHVYILILEMFLWTTPKGLKAFRMTKERADATKTLAFNQGLYNGFLAAGIFWGLLRSDNGAVCFFLSCIAVAGVAGSMTVGKKVLYIQTVPAALGLLFYFFA
jgi:putative membrane protein